MMRSLHMTKVTTEEVQHLADLARIALRDEEAAKLTGEFEEILGYVSEVQEIAVDTGEKKVGLLHNVYREDVDPHEPGIYTEALLAAAPERDGQYLKVKKILGEG